MEWCDLQLYESLNFPASPSDNDLNDSNNTSLHMEQKHLLSGGEGKPVTTDMCPDPHLTYSCSVLRSFERRLPTH